MSSLKFPLSRHWDDLDAHLRAPHGERFAFALTKCLHAGLEPVLEVVDVELISDDETSFADGGWEVDDDAIDRIHNRARTEGLGLIEFHNHLRGPPAFSRTDELGLTPTAEYVISVLPGRPYGAGVFVDGQVHVDYWRQEAQGLQRRTFRSVLVTGDRLRLVNALGTAAPTRLRRQRSLLGARGSDSLGRLRVAIVGAGGTGSQAILALAHLGVGEILIFDDDDVEDTNLNRLVTGGFPDLGLPKNHVAKRRVCEIDPSLKVTIFGGITPADEHPELHDVDVIVGCVDHDGPRDRLNQIAVSTATPYIDIATGTDLDCSPPWIGGRVIFVVKGGPCLYCRDELNHGEVASWTKSPDDQARDRQHGYGSNEADPAVVHLNGITVNAAVTELVAWISGHRTPAQRLDIDLNGNLAPAGHASGARVCPEAPMARRPECVGCAWHWH